MMLAIYHNNSIPKKTGAQIWIPWRAECMLIVHVYCHCHILTKCNKILIVYFWDVVKCKASVFTYFSKYSEKYFCTWNVFRKLRGSSYSWSKKKKGMVWISIFSYLKNEENVVLINGKTLENDEGIGKSCVASRASLLIKSNYSKWSIRISLKETVWTD